MKGTKLVIRLITIVALLILSMVTSQADDIVVAFEQKEYTILAGKNTSIIPVVQGTKQKGKMVYASSDESVASVNNGRVTGHKAGKATITCTILIGDETFVRSYDLTVQQPIKKIEVPKGTIEMPSECKMKETVIHIIPEDATNKTLEFKSSNPKIAKINQDGVISTGGEGGTATITCKATDGSNVKATIKVKVPKTAWFFANSYEINDADGIVFFYKPTASHFLSKEYCSNDNIRFYSAEASKSEIPEDIPFVFQGGSNPLRRIHIIPVKTGKSKFVFDGFMVNKVSVNITVNRAAVFEQLNYEQCMKNIEKNKGLKFSFEGKYLQEENTNGIRSIIFAFEGDETRPVKVNISQDNQKLYNNGKVITVKCVLDGIDDYISETGLKKQIPVFKVQ